MRRRRRRRVNARFFFFIGGIAAVLALIVLVLSLGGGGSDTLTLGSINAETQISGVIVREETVVSTEKYEKINFHVVEGQAVADQTLIATVFKRGYQDESMVAMLNLQKQIREKQLGMSGANDSLAAEYDTRIAATKELIRDAARGYTDQDMLTLESQLRSLQQERISYLRSSVMPDTELAGLYNQLADQENSMKNWTRDIVNTAGSGVVSFYFDGYEQVLNSSKLGTINLSLINSLVKGGNTTKTTQSASESQLYRLVSPNHWYLAFTTDLDDPMRVAAGEEYYVTFDDYSDVVYLATAREPIVFAQAQEEDDEISFTGGVVNILEFYVDIGSFVGIRTVNATINKAAQGLMVEADTVDTVEGVPCVYVESGDSTTRVDVEVLAMDEKNAVIRAKGGANTLAAGQKLVKP